MNDKTIRADKLLSSLGITSRRSVGEFLKKNNVTAKNSRILNAGDRIYKNQKILINGKEIKKPKLVYFMLNKPKGYISTVKDEFGRKNVLSLIKTHARIFPVGRLDKDTHGLLLLTNDGELTQKLIHPKFHIEKVYELKIQGQINKDKIMQFERGVNIEDSITSPAKVNILKVNSQHPFLKLTIYEGKKRQIRRMCEALNIRLLDLKRVSFGKLNLGNLKTGEYKRLSTSEVIILRTTGQTSQE